MAWKKANEGGGIVWCHDSGNTCHTSVKSEESRAGPFASARNDSAFFDAALEELSRKLNDLVEETQAQGRSSRNRDPKVQVGFLVTGAGYLPVWKREVSDSERLEDLVDVGSLTDLDGMSIERRDAHLRVKRDESNAGTWRNHSSSGGVVHCHHNGKSCFVTVEAAFSASGATKYFAEVNTDSPVYDAALATLASKMNALVAEVQIKAKQNRNIDPRLQIGLVATGSGFLPVWKRVLADTERLEDVVDAKSLTHLDTLTGAQLDAHLGVRA